MKKFLLPVLLFATIIANAQLKYYVNGSDSTASDFNTGISPNMAWKTLRRACMDTLSPAVGDTVIVMQGIYRESLKPQKSGITFVSDSAEILGYISLDSVATDSTWQFDSDTLWSNHGFTNVWKRQLSKTGYVEAYRDGQRMPSFKSLDGTGYCISLDSSFIYPNLVNIGSSFISDSLHYLYVILEDTIISPNIYSWQVTKNNGIFVKNKSYITIRGFNVNSFAEVGIQIQGSDHIEVSSNWVHHNGRTGIGVNWANSNILITNNDVSYNGIGLGYSSGISVYRATNQNIYIVGNLSHHNADSSFHHSDGNGFIIDAGADVVPPGGCLFYKNVSYNNQGSGIRIHRSKNCKVINNTTYRNISNEMDLGDQIPFSGNADTSIILDNIVIENNIFFASPNKFPFHAKFLHNPYNIISNYNDFYRNNADSNTALFSIKDTIFIGTVDINQFRNLTGNDSNSFVADPLFVNQVTDSFHLQNVSPCIDAGNPNLQITSIDNQDPDSTRLDIGAYYFSQIVTSINHTIQNEHNVLFIVYPNPFSAQTVLQTDILLKNATLTVYNSFGQQVKQIKNISGRTVVLNRGNLVSGLYFVRLTQDNKVIAINKLVITD